ncbi:recQ-mediated instability protein [Perilla frutescens var. hirtella]|uniref:RecQ-mediated genome instability protein 1 n=1 Tax=Perilla frutescens var. hirtella TaxID=608512 RepID=A0AAD4P9S8_PERFH|nr:recQ-mediated instability protein [Perilla frutescens var. hirtella]
MDGIIMDGIETDFQTVTLNSANPTPSSSNSVTNTYRHGNLQFESIPIDISDEDLENITIGDSTDNSVPETVRGDNSYLEVSESPVHGVLERLGLRLRREWLDSCLQGLQSSVQGFQRMDDSAKAKLCFQQFLWSDISFCGAGVLPPDVHTLHLVDLKGPFVLQVDEIVNLSSPIRGRYQNAAPGIKRCLKLSMTDGIQRVFGMEYRPIKDLQVLGPAGLKVAVCNVNVRHGLLMLVPEVVEVLGGTVDELEAARQRLVEEVNKPPRGRRTRTGVVPLTTRATLAAWPPRNDAVPGHVDRNHPADTIPLQSSGQGSAPSIPANDMHRQDLATPFSRNNAGSNMSHAPRPLEQDEIPGHTDTPIVTRSRQGPDRPRKDFATPISRNNDGPNTSHAPWPPEQDEIPVHIDTPAVTRSRQGPDRPRQDFEVPVNRSNGEPRTVSAMQPAQSVTISQHINEPSIGVMTPLGGTRQGIPANYMPGEEVLMPVSRDNAEPNTYPTHMDVEEISMVDDFEHHFILSREKEIPFTYLASLSAKCAANDDETSIVQGKIKFPHVLTLLVSLWWAYHVLPFQCFLTGVKRFQYKQNDIYELRVYVDDGSLISEILISHNVVRNRIGYSPQEVTIALESSESQRVSEMKEILKQFQTFLVNFEGTMIVEMSNASPVPVALEMNQGCIASDGWLLLKRVKSFISPQQQDDSHLNPIALSP